MTNVSMKDIYKVIYNLLVYISLNIFYLTKALTNRAKPYAKVSADSLH